MLVGHYTDAADKHAARRMNGRAPGDIADPRMSTWRNLHKLCARAELDLREIFLTNIYVGLKAGDQHGKFPGAGDRSFRDWCRAFLDDQIRLMQPRAIVTLGDEPRKEFTWQWGYAGNQARAGIEFEGAALMHPSSPTFFQRMPDGRQRIDHLAEILQLVSRKPGRVAMADSDVPSSPFPGHP